jgi:sialic acid synthase SpsE
VVNRIEIIAELAQGFEGRPEQARLLMKAAAAGGADAAKYQLVYADELAAPDYEHYALFKTLEMSDEVWAGVAAYSNELGIKLYLDIFGKRSLELAERIGASAVKLHPTDVANTSLLNAVAASSANCVLLGVGGTYATELDDALQTLSDKSVVLLLGFQGYPTPEDSNQIARVRLLADRVAKRHPDARIGFADHAAPESPVRFALAATAVGAGARIIEKHLTLGRIMKLEDHESALDPDEFLEFTQTIRACGRALGFAADSEDFGMSVREVAYRAAIRRHVVAARALAAGSVLGPADLVLKRTSAHQPLTELRSTYGRTLKRGVAADMAVRPSDIE